MGGKDLNFRVLVDLKRIVAYICPFCSNMSSKSLSIFNFSGKDKVQLICPTHGCHETCVTIAEKHDKYKFDIECPICGDNHSYTTTKENFWNKPLLTYKCPVAGIDVFFAGEKDLVENMLNENTDMFSDILDEFDDDDSDISFNLIYAIIERLHALQESHNISCACGSEDIELNIINGNIILTCLQCKKSKAIETTEETFTRLLNAKAIIIGK